MALMTQQATAKRVTATGAVAEAVLDTGLYPATKLEVVVNSSVVTTYAVYGSIDGESGNWRQTASIIVGAGDVDTDLSAFYDNAYRYVKIATTDVGNHLIEIAGGQG